MPRIKHTDMTAGTPHTDAVLPVAFPGLNCNVEVAIAHDGLEVGHRMCVPRRVAKNMIIAGYWKLVE